MKESCFAIHTLQKKSTVGIQKQVRFSNSGNKFGCQICCLSNTIWIPDKLLDASDEMASNPFPTQMAAESLHVQLTA